MGAQPEVNPHADQSRLPVFHPAVGDVDREAVLRYTQVSASACGRDRVASGLRGQDASDSKQIISLLVVIALCTGILGLLGLVVSARVRGGLAVLTEIAQQLGYSVAIVLLLCPFALVTSLLGRRRARKRQARAAERAIRLRRHYILPHDDLDEPDRALLARARAAAQTVADSQDCDRGAAGGFVLAHLVWDVADELAELARQRRLIDRLAPDAGPATKAALAPRAAALDMAAAALQNRVAELEAHARRIAELEAAHRDLATARTLMAEDPTLDLVSRRTRDVFAAEDIARLSGPVTAQRDHAALEAYEIAESARQLSELVSPVQPADPPQATG
jgi:hypothetical protein